jgi:predicted HicB family RNase H-like nuclease
MAQSQERCSEQLSVPVDPDLRAAVERAAKQEGRTIANYVRRVVAQAVEQAAA